MSTYATVYMTNKDAYNLTEGATDKVLDAIADGTAVLQVKDSKSGANVTIFTKHISSIVVRGGNNG